jgi:hypothetical protein
MSRVTPQMRDFSQSLIAYEAKENHSSGTKASPAFHVFEKLRPYLATIMGSAGFHALLGRALAVARPESAWLRTVQVGADGSLEGFDGLPAQGAENPEGMAEGCVILVAQLLGLLVAFIGEDLTLRIVCNVWPKLSLNDLDFGNRDHK